MLFFNETKAWWAVNKAAKKDPRPDRISLDGQTGPIGFWRKSFPFSLFLT